VTVEPGKRQRQAIKEERPVGQVGQRVMENPVGEPVLSVIRGCRRRPCREPIMCERGAICEDRDNRR
jgi:hypothetical protein